jgi:energy-coupling factor transporter ATP-binding protein EcfA2
MIQCRNLTYRYSNGRGIQNVTLSIAKDSMYLLVGSNGSGKSTLLKLLAGGLFQYSGIATIDGLHIHETHRNRGRRFTVALSPQQPETQFSLPTVRDELRFTAKAIKKLVDLELESKILNLLQLTEFLESSPFDLPPIKRKLLSLAIAAVIPSPFIALDEPTAGIDLEHKNLVLNFVRFLHTQKGVIIVSHDIDTFLAMATDIGIMEDGNLIESSEKNIFLENFLKGKYSSTVRRPFIVPRIAQLLINKTASSIRELADKITKSIKQK